MGGSGPKKQYNLAEREEGTSAAFGLATSTSDKKTLGKLFENFYNTTDEELDQLKAETEMKSILRKEDHHAARRLIRGNPELCEPVLKKLLIGALRTDAVSYISHRIGLCQMDKNEFEEAEQTFKTVLYNHKPGNELSALLLIDLAELALIQGQRKQARDCLESAAAYSGVSDKISCLRKINEGRLWSDTGKLREAKEEFELAKRLDKESSAPHYWMALVFEKEGDIKMARLEADRAWQKAYTVDDPFILSAATEKLKTLNQANNDPGGKPAPTQ